MDILGPFPLTLEQRKFLLVAIDYFIKWVKAKPLAKITEVKVIDFVWKTIICRFDLPRVIITDNGRQFSGSKFAEFCRNRGISQYFTSVGHPQTNGEAKVTNKTILQGLKTKVDRAKGAWVDELYNILWAYRTTQKTPTGETPFKLSFGTEAVISMEIGLPSFRVKNYDDEANVERLHANLDLLKEVREKIRIRMAVYQQKMARYYNSHVRNKKFKIDDLVL